MVRNIVAAWIIFTVNNSSVKRYIYVAHTSCMVVNVNANVNQCLNIKRFNHAIVATSRYCIARADIVGKQIKYCQWTFYWYVQYQHLKTSRKKKIQFLILWIKKWIRAALHFLQTYLLLQMNYTLTLFLLFYAILLFTAII